MVLGAVNAQQDIVLRPHRLSLGDFALWCHQKLQSTDAVALQATSKAWTIYDQLVGRAAYVVVANPLQLKWMAATRVKTDPHDSLKLARWLAAGLIPTVWVPLHPSVRCALWSPIASDSSVSARKPVIACRVCSNATMSPRPKEICLA